MNDIAVNEAFLQQIERLQTVLKNNVAGTFGGNHKSRTFGSSCEFVDAREYVPGDDISKIDWNAYARFETLYLKLYLDERQLHTKIYIDVSQSMAFGNSKKRTAALQIAATLAYLSIAELDKVSIYTVRNAEVEEIISAISGRERYFAEITKLNDIRFFGDCSISESILPSDVGYGNGLSIIISDFLTDNDYERAVDFLADKKRDVFCIQILDPEELNPKIRGKNVFFDSENPNNSYRKNINRDIVKAYKQAVQFVQDRVRNCCLARGAEYALVRSDKPISEIFFEQFAQSEVIK
ncbi:MAG: DUF58 domain-containing protein [Bacteroides sp.]|nr:DUF58 domain-containing protein [Bacillota bacterium]MCM1455656.1 DUF58 domain-containing protein [Bacteroides sp.]